MQEFYLDDDLELLRILHEFCKSKLLMGKITNAHITQHSMERS